MKKLKQIFGFMLVGVLLLTGSFALTGCFEKEGLTKQDKIEIALAVVNDAKFKFEKSSTIEVNQAVESDVNASMELFTQYGDIVNEHKEEFTTITQDYLEMYSEMGVLNYILTLLYQDNFEFNTQYVFNDNGDIGKQSIEFYDDYIRYIVCCRSGVEGDYSDVSIIVDIMRNDKSAVAYTMCDMSKEVEDGTVDIDYTYIKFSTSDNRLFDYIEEVDTRKLDDNGENIGYYCTLYSEINGYTFTLIKDTIKLIGSSTENVAQMFELMKSEPGYDVFAAKCKEKIDNCQEIVNGYLN